MSYRLIVSAVLSIVSASGAKSEAKKEVRAYVAPKAPATGEIEIVALDGSRSTAPTKRTGGIGRGTVVRNYLYFPLAFGGKAESAYVEIDASEAAALIGGRASLALVAEPATPAPAEAEAPKAEAPEAPKATRRAKADA
jgi:hypothetical protein